LSNRIGEIYLESVLHRFRANKKLAEAALKQLSDGQFTATVSPDSNSIALLLQHLHGNMLSRWTDFLTTDGEKPWRDRDAEFVLDPALTRDERMQRWEDGWRCLFGAIEPLRPEDLLRTVMIRDFEYSVLDAIERQVFHISYHIGQILLITKTLRGDGWKYLSIPPGESRKYEPKHRD
jgi:hypothetical protein